MLAAAPSQAQNEVVLQIHHLFNDEPLVVGQVYSVQDTEVRVDRLEYYLCDFVITHDGGQETALEEVYVLADVNDDGAYSLGEWDVDQVEGISFGVGVDADHNVGIDPSTYPGGHPLAPQMPSMHWGWASGYRFLALEGFAGTGLAAQYQVHALGDQNFHHQTHSLSASPSEGVVTMYLNANYEGAFTELPVSQGFIEHSSTAEAADAMDNMRDWVFEAGAPTSVAEAPLLGRDLVYPNPAADWLSVDLPEGTHPWVVYDVSGEQVMEGKATASQRISTKGLVPGVYFFVVTGENGRPARSVRFVKQ